MKPTDALPHPLDWQTTTVGEAVNLKRGVSWSKDQEHRIPRKGTTPVIRIGNVHDRLELEDLLYISGLNQATLEAKRVTSGWSIIVGSNGNRNRVGNAVLVNRDTDYLFASFLVAVRPKESFELKPEYFYRWLTAERIQAYLSASAEGTTGLNNLSHSFFRAMKIPYPCPEEQEAIVRTLDAVDTAIERTREAVERAEDIRRALVQKAFGFELAEEAMKDTEVGRVPCSWDVKRGKRMFVLLSGGNSSVEALRRSKEDGKVDAWFMKVDDFNSPENSRAIVRTKIGFRASENPKFRVLPTGTVIIAKRGAAILKNRVRTTAVPVALDPNLMGIQMLPGIIPEFFRYQLEWRNLSRYLEDSGVPQLNNKDLYPRYFLKAPEDQQEEIVATVSAAEGYQDALLSKMEAFGRLKKSLTHDLLTGKVRVKNAELSRLSSEET